jgi:hypothetical protein
MPTELNQVADVTKVDVCNTFGRKGAVVNFSTQAPATRCCHLESKPRAERTLKFSRKARNPEFHPNFP